MNILDYFPGRPRRVQEYVLKQLEKNWRNYSVFVIQAPVASGKSRIGVTLARWAAAQQRGAALVTPTNVLVKQYKDEFPELPTAEYRTSANYGRSLGKFRNSPVILANYYTYLAHRAYRDLLIADEAHNLLPALTAQGITKLWNHLYGLPEDLRTVADLLEWCEQDHSQLGGTKENKIKNVAESLRNNLDNYVIEKSAEDYRGKEQKLVKLTPLSARDSKPILWPKRVKKLVLMSATISEHDVYDLGLDSRRVLYIQCDSPIPAGNRPVYPLDVANVTYSTERYAVPLLSTSILSILDKHKSPGIIHCTYSLARKLERSLAGRTDRLIFHEPYDREEKYRKFLTEPKENGKVLVACGMDEGIDLSYDLARWQIICKVPYANLSEPAVAARLAKRPESYAWWAARKIIQACGRVVRTPTDRGTTYILDQNFRRLYENYPNLWPDWFREAVRN